MAYEIPHLLFTLMFLTPFPTPFLLAPCTPDSLTSWLIPKRISHTTGLALCPLPRGFSLHVGMSYSLTCLVPPLLSYLKFQYPQIPSFSPLCLIFLLSYYHHLTDFPISFPLLEQSSLRTQISIYLFIPLTVLKHSRHTNIYQIKE